MLACAPLALARDGLRARAAQNKAFQPAGLSCPSVSMCVGIGFGGMVEGRNLDGASQFWTAFPVRSKDNYLGYNVTAGSVACPSITTCLAIGSFGSSARRATSWVFTSQTMTTAVPRWKVAPGIPPLGVPQCPSISVCYALLDRGEGAGVQIAASSNAFTSTPAWTRTSLAVRATSFACPTVAQCVLLTQGVGSTPSGIWTSEDAASPSPTWTMKPFADSAAYYHDSVLSCPSADMCVTAGYNGYVAVSTNVRASTPEWSVSQVDPPTTTAIDQGFVAIDCPSTSLCVAANTHAVLFATRDPAAEQPTWTRTQFEAPNEGISAIVCPTVQMCALQTDSGAVSLSTSPADGDWSPLPVGFMRGRLSFRGGLDYQPFARVDGRSCSHPAPCITSISAARVVKRDVTFTFRGSSRLTCALLPGARSVPPNAAGVRYRPCRSPRTYRGLKKGTYLFAVRRAGASSPPATRAIAIGESPPSVADGPAPRGEG